MDWNLVLRDPATGAELALLDWLDLSLTENFDGITGKLTIPGNSEQLAWIRVLLVDVLVYSDRALTYRMRVVNADDKLTTEAHTVTLELAGYEHLLSRRVLFDDMDRAEDQHLWAWDIVTYTQAFQDLGIRQAEGFLPAGQNRDRLVQKGKTITEAINELAENDNGFDWWIDADLKFHAMTPRRFIPFDVDWSWGGEVASFDRKGVADAYASVVYVLGATNETTMPSGTVYPPPPPVLRELTDKPYGRWERTVSYSDIVTEESLTGKAIWHLADSSTMRPLYNLELTAGAWTPKIRPGTTFLFRARSRPRLDFKVQVRVEQVQLKLDGNGVEEVKLATRAETAEEWLIPRVPHSVPPGIPDTLPISSSPPIAVLVDPPAATGRTPTLAFLDNNDRLGALLALLRTRLARQERSV